MAEKQTRTRAIATTAKVTKYEVFLMVVGMFRFKGNYLIYIYTHVIT